MCVIQEPMIAYDLIKRGSMTKHGCVDMTRILNHYFWIVCVLDYYITYMKQNAIFASEGNYIYLNGNTYIFNNHAWFF